MRSLAFVVASLLLVACSSSHDRTAEDGGRAIRDGGTPERDAGTPERDAGPPDAGLPPECRTGSTAPGPHATTFRFTNDGDVDVWLLEECRYRFTVSSCESGYEPISLYGDCTVDCAEGSGACIACGACMYSPVMVPPGGSVEVAWPGMTYTFDTTPSGCSCHHASPAPAARYRVSVPVYETPDDATTGMALRNVEVEFALPAPGGVVTVPLGG